MRNRLGSGRLRLAPREVVLEGLKTCSKTLSYPHEYWAVKLLKVELERRGIRYSLKRIYTQVKELGYRLRKSRLRRYKEEVKKIPDFKKVKEELDPGCRLFLID